MCFSGKKTKFSDESISEVETTTIESLPDDVGCHILSFLTTRDAAAAGFLSKRWRSLWLSLRSFEFNDTYFRDFRKFSNFINSVLFPRNSIQSLRLTCGLSYAFTLEGFDLFLYGLALKGIQELHLQLVTSTTILPYGFYGCKTLVTLKLNNVTLNCPSYDFPLLKYLDLIQVTFKSHSVMFKFFCACPNVEDLDARSLTIVGGNIPSSAEEGAEVLPKLIMANISQFFHFNPLASYIPFHALCKAQFLRARMVTFCLLLSNNT